MKVTYLLLACIMIFALAGATFAQMTDDEQQMPSGQQQQSTTTTTTGTDVARYQAGPVLRVGQPASADVFVNNRMVMRIASAAGGYTPAQRAEIISNRLNQAFAAGESWQNMRVARVNNSWAVTIGDRLIATADSRSARDLGLSQGMLANRWASQTVLAMGGAPQQIFAQLQPVQQQVAGSQQEIGAAWTTATSKSVPLLDANTGNALATVTVGGTSTSLSKVNSVLLYQSNADNAIVKTFVPIAGTDATNPVRIANVGLVSIPATMIPTTGYMTGSDLDEASDNFSDLNTKINSNISMTGTNTKVVPLYSTSNIMVGAAQIIGDPTAVNNTAAVSTAVVNDMMRFSATSDAVPSATSVGMKNVLIQSIILYPQAAGSTGTSESTDQY